MKIIFNKIFSKYNLVFSPENKKRLESFKKVKESEIENGEKYLELVHSSKYINAIKNQRKLNKFLDWETVISKESYKIACFAVGAAVAASQKGDFALIRPPGHHASRSKGKGFCIFNNIAIASESLVRENKKVLIFDFDGHFGNGTSEIFYASNKVLYFSIHQYPAYPGTGDVNEIGTSEGQGYNINIPLPPESGDDLFINSFFEILPILKQFNPDFVGVSAGFDGHWTDSLLQLNFSLNSYYQIGNILSKNFNNIFAVLEGGYNPKYLSKCVYNFVAGINQTKIRFVENKTISSNGIKEEYKKRLRKLKNNLSNFWDI